MEEGEEIREMEEVEEIREMEEVEEIREMEGRRYVGRFQLAQDGVSREQIIYDKVSGAREVRQLR